MRTTVRIDDDLMRELKERAHREGTSLTKLINRLLRRGFNTGLDEGGAVDCFREETFSMLTLRRNQQSTSYDGLGVRQGEP